MRDSFAWRTPARIYHRISHSPEPKRYNFGPESHFYGAGVPACLLKSCVDPVDRRKQIARLTQKGEAVMKKHALNLAKFDVVFASFTLEELASLTELLHRFEECFANPTEESSVQLP